MGAIDKLLGGKKTKSKQKNSAILRLAEPKVNLSFTPPPPGTKGVPVLSLRPFNPQNPDYQKNMEGPKQGVFNALKRGDTYTDAAKTGARLAKDAVVGPAKGTYDLFANPSQPTKELERITGVSKLPSGLRQPLQAITRLVGAAPANLGDYVGREIVGERQLANKVVRGELPASVLTTKKPDLQDVGDILEHSVNTVLTFYTGGKAKTKAGAVAEIPKTIKKVYSGKPVGLSKSVEFFTPDKTVASKYAELSKTVNGKATVVEKNIEGLKLKRVSQKNMLNALEDPKIKEKYDGIQFTKNGEKQPTYALFEKKSSRIGKSIEAKAIEQKLTQGFDNVAGYDPITIKQQAALAAETLGDLNRTRRIVTGAEPLPQGLNPVALITAVEEHIAKTGDAKLAYELANSPLITETSIAAQTLRLAAERNPDNVTVQLRALKQAREQAVIRRQGPKAQRIAKNELKTDLVKASPKAKDWAGFLQELKCK